MEVIIQWPDFRKEFIDSENFFARIVLPARVGLLRICTDDQGRKVMYTYMRSDTPVLGLPTAKDWRAGVGLLWLGDLCYDKGIKASAATLLVGQDMVDNGIAHENERIVFYRGYSKRYGYSRVKTGRRANGFRFKRDDIRGRPVGEHARLAEGQPEG